jgi:FkbM family methyltransferase
MRDASATIEPIALSPGLAVLRALPLPRILGLLERLYGRALAKHEIAWIRTASGVVWKLDLRDSCQRWIVYGDYEGKVQMDWIRSWLRAGGTVVDSGASIGQMLLYLAPLPDLKIHAFEPIPASASWLRECLHRQDGWTVEVIETALSDHRGTLQLQVAGPHSTARMDWYQDRQHSRAQVNTVPLDDYSDESGIAQIRFWKLDVEGSEAQALAGAQRLLSQQRIDALLVESCAESDAAIHALLSRHGYIAMRIGPRQTLVRDPSPVTTLTNRIFIRAALGPPA